MSHWSANCHRGVSSPVDPHGNARISRNGEESKRKRRDTMSQSGHVSGARSKSMGEREDVSERGHVLLLEDDETLAALLARVLRNEGYTVDLLDRADHLPSAQKLTRYDVVLSDIHLAEGTSGHDVLKRVRANAGNLPVILMTAYADIEGAMNAVGAGAYEYLAKPI